MTFVHFVRPFGLAAVLACGIGALASAQAPQSQPATAQEQQVTVTGCVERESDYRRAQDAGRGGVAGTGIGAGNEFVLSSASTSSGAAGASAAAPQNPPSQAPGAGTAAKGIAYELTGSNEGQLAKHVGHRVEITGKLKAAEAGPSGNPTGGPTAGRPPSGVDVASKDLKLRELEVTSVRMVSDTCPA